MFPELSFFFATLIFSLLIMSYVISSNLWNLCFFLSLFSGLENVQLATNEPLKQIHFIE